MDQVAISDWKSYQCIFPYFIIFFLCPIYFQETLLKYSRTMWVVLSWCHQVVTTPTADSLPCTFQDLNVTQRYQRTKQGFYPFQPALGIEALVDSDNIPNWQIPSYDQGSQISRCRQGVSPNIRLNNPTSRSLCPWYYQTDYQEDRFPAIISKAKCRCKHCLNPTTSMIDRDLSCRPIKYRMPILKLAGCVEGLLKYNMTSVEVPVACACMRNPIN